jgi:hypothetical protein
MTKIDKETALMKTIDSIYSKFYQWYQKNDYIAIDAFIKAMDFEMTPEIRVTVLTGSLPMKSKFANRPAFFDKTYNLLKRKGFDADNILIGLI